MNAQGEIRYRSYVIHHDGTEWVADEEAPDIPIFQLGAPTLELMFKMIDELWACALASLRDADGHVYLPRWYDTEAVQSGLPVRMRESTSAPADAIPDATLAKKWTAHEYATVGAIPLVIASAIMIPLGGPVSLVIALKLGTLAPAAFKIVEKVREHRQRAADVKPVPALV